MRRPPWRPSRWPPSPSRALALALLAAGLLVALTAPAQPGGLGAAALLGGLALAPALLLAVAPPGRGRAYRTFALRVALGLALLPGGLLLLATPAPLHMALGVAWLVGGLGAALGVLAPWAGLYAAIALPLAGPVSPTLAWSGLALAALALALSDDDRLAVDALLRRRGGVFPTFRREVVLEPLRR